MMTLGYLVTVLAMIRVGGCFSAMAPGLPTGPLLTATGVLVLHLLKQRGLHCYRFSGQYFIWAGARMFTPRPQRTAAVLNAPENKVGVLQGSIRWAVLGGAMVLAVLHRCTRYGCRWERPVPLPVCLAVQRCDLPWVGSRDLQALLPTAKARD